MINLILAALGASFVGAIYYIVFGIDKVAINSMLAVSVWVGQYGFSVWLALKPVIVPCYGVMDALAQMALSRVFQYSVGLSWLALTICAITFVYGQRGPYDVTEPSFLRRAFQRFVVEKSRRKIPAMLYPLNALGDVKPRRAQDNGHGISGAIRDEARRLIQATVQGTGCDIFEVSPSVRSSTSYGMHQHYAVGDLDQDIKVDTPKPGQVTVCIDTDYYIRSPETVFGYENCAIIHTFNPRKVGGLDGDSRFTIVDDVVNYEVGGGGCWKHRVWDWCKPGEYIRFKHQEVMAGWLGWLCWFFRLERYIYHKVHHSRPWIDCPDRLLVWLVPQYSVWTVAGIGLDLGSRALGRVRYSSKLRPGWNQVLSVGTDNIPVLNIGRNGEDATVTLDKADVDILLGLDSAQSVTTRLLAFKYTDPRTIALFGQYYKALTRDNDVYPIVARSVQPTVHWPSQIESDVAEVTARCYGKPVVENCSVMPQCKRWEVLSDSLEARVSSVVNRRVPNKSYVSLAHEFVTHLVPTQGVGNPLTAEEARERLDKPSQVNAVNRVWDTLDVTHRRLIEAFTKNEPTMKSPRIISSFPDARYLLKFSKYTLAFREAVLHSEGHSHWFYPSRAPAQIAAGVTEFAQSVENICETDFSNLDGTVSEWLQRYVMNAVYLRYFGDSDELRSLTEDLVRCPARAKRFGFRYEAGVGVKSGSPTTCDLNTVVNAFVEFCAIRKSRQDLTTGDCFGLLGPKFGDDGLCDANLEKSVSKVARDLGLKVKTERCTNETGVTFLARVFIDPLTTSTSMQDPLRTWRKLHLTTRDPNVPIESAAYDRLTGYLVSDRLSPLTGAYAESVTQHYRYKATADRRRLGRACRLAEKPYWLTSGSWPQSEDDVDAMRAVTIARTGISLEWLTETEQRLRQNPSPWEFETWAAQPGDLDPVLNSIGRDGLPTEPSVDRNVFRVRKNVQTTRADPSLSREHTMPGARDRLPAGAVAPAKTAQRVQGPGGLQGTSPSPGDARAKGGGRFVGQAQHQPVFRRPKCRAPGRPATQRPSEPSRGLNTRPLLDNSRRSHARDKQTPKFRQPDSPRPDVSRDVRTRVTAV